MGSTLNRHPNLFVTKIYEALNLSGYKGDKIKTELLEKGFLNQEETQGEKGRLAKVLTLTSKGLQSLSQPGKGGDLHKHLQKMVKEQAELFNWQAVIEEGIEGSKESVDVGLTKGDLKVAVEISVTTDVEDEIHNIQKCLMAGYDNTICVISNEKTRNDLKLKGRQTFSPIERRRIKYCAMNGVKTFLQVIDTPIDSKEIGVYSQNRNQNLLNTKEAAEYLGISPFTLYGLVSQRRIPHLKVGKLNKFKKTDLDNWLERNKRVEQKFI
jgi:excisionase family DNA binding protein